ncbi:hypothetical protein K1X84_09935 [bacterium]|nr:hypothetical protein [bacterium]
MKKFLFVFMTLASCSTNYDSHTPEGAHNLLVKYFTEHHYEAIYSLLPADVQNDFKTYLAQTREVVQIIRQQYPIGVRYSAITDLSIPFDHQKFTIEDIETSSTTEEAFAKLCSKMFGSDFSLTQEFGAKIQSVETISDSEAVVTTIAEEKIIYKRDTDGLWKTDDVFGRHFMQLVSVSAANLAITKTNAELYAK